MSQLIDLGVVMVAPTAAQVQLAEVTQAGVAPEDFYVTTIYPTEVNVQGRWIRVAKQRMDGVVVVEAIINRQGSVDEVKVLKGLPMGLSEEAVEAGPRRNLRNANGDQERSADVSESSSDPSRTATPTTIEASARLNAGHQRRSRKSVT